jgi:hypothetical protein
MRRLRRTTQGGFRPQFHVRRDGRPGAEDGEDGCEWSPLCRAGWARPCCRRASTSSPCPDHGLRREDHRSTGRNPGRRPSPRHRRSGSARRRTVRSDSGHARSHCWPPRRPPGEGRSARPRTDPPRQGSRSTPGEGRSPSSRSWEVASPDGDRPTRRSRRRRPAGSRRHFHRRRGLSSDGGCSRSAPDVASCVEESTALLGAADDEQHLRVAPAPAASRRQTRAGRHCRPGTTPLVVDALAPRAGARRAGRRSGLDDCTWCGA